MAVLRRAVGLNRHRLNREGLREEDKWRDSEAPLKDRQITPCPGTPCRGLLGWVPWLRTVLDLTQPVPAKGEMRKRYTSSPILLLLLPQPTQMVKLKQTNESL